MDANVSLLHDAIACAMAAHANQTDKGGQPYILHCVAVMATVDISGLEPQVAACVRSAAVLHDVVEDTAVTMARLSLEFPTLVVELVDALTKRQGETYWDYIDRVKKNHLAVRIKIADARHNADPSRPLPPGSEGLRRKYEKTVNYLLHDVR